MVKQIAFITSLSVKKCSCISSVYWKGSWQMWGKKRFFHHMGDIIMKSCLYEPKPASDMKTVLYAELTLAHCLIRDYEEMFSQHKIRMRVKHTGRFIIQVNCSTFLCFRWAIRAWVWAFCWLFLCSHPHPVSEEESRSLFYFILLQIRKCKNHTTVLIIQSD